MSILEKVRNFFYDDEYEEEEEKPKKEKRSKDKIKVREIKEEPKEEQQQISERELFKAERTFNFPMDVDDEYVSKTEKVKITEEPKAYNKVTVKEPENNSYTGIRNYAKYESYKEEEKPREKKFKPTPVISPIYGIMDKNYKKEDLINGNTSKSNEETQRVDYDSVRRKAYANVYSEEAQENQDSQKIFYNLDEEENKNDDVKIVYNDVTFEEENNEENITIEQKIKEYEKTTDEETEIEEEEVESAQEDIDEESQILSETKEQDLFNLIDNMYNSDEEDEEEEV